MNYFWLNKKIKKAASNSSWSGTARAASSNSADYESNSTSNFSTLDRSPAKTDKQHPSSVYSSPTSTRPPHRLKKKTFYINSTFKHDVIKNSTVNKSLETTATPPQIGDTAAKNQLLLKIVDSKLRNKISFMESSLVGGKENKDLAKILLDLDDVCKHKEVSSSSSSLALGSPRPPVVACAADGPPLSPSSQIEIVDSNDKENGEDDNIIKNDKNNNHEQSDINIPEFETNNLNPKFLLIDDEDDSESEIGKMMSRTKTSCYIFIKVDRNLI